MSIALPYKELSYITADGLRLYARDYNQAGDTAPLILCLHGLTRNSADFAPLAAHLAPTYRLIIPDQRGRGRSEYDTQPSRYNPLTYCQDMLGLLAELGIKHCAIIGTSMGGIMAMMLAAISPGLITAAVINDIGPDVDAKGLARIKGYIGKTLSKDVKFENWSLAANAVAATNAIAFPDYKTDDWYAFAKRVCEPCEPNSLRYAYDPHIAAPILAQDKAAAPPNLWPLYDQLCKNPVLLIRGELSDILSQHVFEKMQNVHAKGVTVPNIGHAPILDEPAALNEIMTFLETHLGVCPSSCNLS